MGSIEEVTAGSLSKGFRINFPVTVGTSDVPINVPTGGPWSYLKVIVKTADREVAVAINEAAVLGTAGAPPDPVAGAGDVIYGTAAELSPVSPLRTNDQVHLISDQAGTEVRLVFGR